MFRLSRFFPNPSALPDQKKYVVQTFPLSTHSKQPTSAAIERWKHPIRGGQNLTIRYQRLEKSLRGKEAYEQTISNLTDFPRSTSPNRSTPGLAKKNVQTFMGFMVPEEPRPPASDECCMSGCAICVHDLYQEALSDYQASTSSLRDSLRKLHISEDQWPLSIRTEAPKELAKNIRLSAFEELERKLKEKHEKQVHDEPLG